MHHVKGMPYPCINQHKLSAHASKIQKIKYTHTHKKKSITFTIKSFLLQNFIGTITFLVE